MKVYLEDIENELTAAEKRLVNAVQSGTVCRLVELNELSSIDAKDGKHWPVDRQISASFIETILSGQLYVRDGRDETKIEANNIFIIGAKITGTLRGRGRKFRTQLSFRYCHFDKTINLSDCEILGLDLSGSHVRQIFADRAIIKGKLKISRNFTSETALRFIRAEIFGDVEFGQAKLPEHNYAVSFSGAKIHGCVIFKEKFRSLGFIDFSHTRIDGYVSLNRTRIDSKEYALSFEGAEISSDVFLRNAFFNGEVTFYGAKITGNFQIDKSTFCSSEDSYCLNVSRAKVDGNAFIETSNLRGEVSFWGTEICGSLFIRLGTEIKSREKECADYERESRPLMDAEHIHVGHSVLIYDGVNCHGEISLKNAEVGGDLVLRAKEEGLSIDQKNRRMSYIRSLSLLGANICGAINMRSLVRIDRLDLRDAHAQTLIDSTATWPKSDHLQLDRFTYEGFGGNAPVDWKPRLNWLLLQPPDDILGSRFKSQPFEQLASVLEKSGDERSAKEIRIKKQDYLRRSGKISGWLNRRLHFLLGISIGYGYRPFRALLLAVITVAMGSVVFLSAFEENYISGSKVRNMLGQAYVFCGELPKSYPPFNPIIFSVDTFVPFLDLQMEEYWKVTSARVTRPLTCLDHTLSPHANADLNSGYIFYYYLHVGLGWILATLFVGGFTGLIKRD